MTGFMDDPGVADRVLRHIADGTTDRGDAVWREPVANYRSGERLDCELRVLRSFPTPFCRRAESTHLAYCKRYRVTFPHK